MGSVHQGTAPPAGGRPRPGFPQPTAGAARHARPGQHPLLSLTRTCPQAPRQSPPPSSLPFTEPVLWPQEALGWRPLSSQKPQCRDPTASPPDRGAASGSRRGSFARGLVGRALAGPRAHAWSRTHPSGRCQGGGPSTPNIYSANAPAALSKPKYFLLLENAACHELSRRGPGQGQCRPGVSSDLRPPSPTHVLSGQGVRCLHTATSVGWRCLEPGAVVVTLA